MKYLNYDVVFREFPDEVTLAINLTGCPNRCPGCHSPALQEDVGDELTETRLAALIEGRECLITCVGFMGGDARPEEVVRLAAYVKLRWPWLHTGWYSGRSVTPPSLGLSSLDYLKLGPYVAARGPLDRPTTNQRLYRLYGDGRREDLTPRFWNNA